MGNLSGVTQSPNPPDREPAHGERKCLTKAERDAAHFHQMRRAATSGGVSIAPTTLMNLKILNRATAFTRH